MSSAIQFTVTFTLPAFDLSPPDTIEMFGETYRYLWDVPIVRDMRLGPYAYVYYCEDTDEMALFHEENGLAIQVEQRYAGEIRGRIDEWIDDRKEARELAAKWDKEDHDFYYAREEHLTGERL